ncbi:MAG: phosphoribosylformylglycinamidine synthase subunit PurL [Candidatus Buchananbacteria bacterium CG10_big_fil_rev_8_21_14_0_10_42_9]|uniref:Phosphoribosylformylglycinamidine synthase subunit PurL n=1 Tax=Candidatus Buchananbacteria bacterium CG10_big_fil_rev_8_21_14_0_10_42_9 TaxID=1974526 RepID=A0A2H0W0L1_9BACT|nr:MAG: phosphoribosylformylglycinamidine synthase subunit PurL [Candidatus Buchananbacteria bacterium CG10_big_fil_rev_8_21_14_0_10_42_9]
MVHRVEVATKSNFLDAEGEALKQAAAHFGITGLEVVRVVKVYKLEGLDADEKLHDIKDRLLHEPIWQDAALDQRVVRDEENYKTVEIALKPGIMDTEIESVMRAVADLGIKGLSMAGTGKRFLFQGNISHADLSLITEKLLMNKIIQRVLDKPEETLLIDSEPKPTEIITLRSMNDSELIALSDNRLWLNLEEMKVIQEYFRKLDRDPTDVELEMLAQTWSEHCGHKTFKAKLVINGREKEPLMTRIKKATQEINSPNVISVFEDNSGVIKFFNGLAVCGKVETHNSPSAIEPYGGAMTGSGGVFRDVVGTGQGAKTIISTDIFCFAPFDTDQADVPVGCIHPQRLGSEVVRGVKDYGNRMGIPTNNGSLHFHPDFVAKPSVIVGAFGIMPEKFARKGRAKPGDKIITVGGKTGRDGIHGATFSSGEMTAETESISSSAVQIGNAIEEKRMFDAILAARDKGLIRAITDLGAGGFSSGIGEMGEDTGARVDLDKIPLKYHGLAPWEIWLSESQERMVMAVDAKDVAQIKKVFKDFNVEATEIGEFTDDKKLTLNYNGEIVGKLEMEFLHGGLPQRVMSGEWHEPKLVEPELLEPKDYNETLKQILCHWNVCSKEPIVRLYDHEVQGTSVLKPYSGTNKDAPNDAAIIEPVLGSGQGLATAHGMNPIYNKINPYWGAASAFDECVRNLVASGVDPKNIALLDNFIWPFPDAEELGKLDRAVDACYDITTTWQMPIVSGKDSLSSTYRGPDGTVIKIPPTLCVSGFAPLEDISKTISAGLKQAGNWLFIVGETKAELGGSVYYDLHTELGASVPHVDIQQARVIFEKMHSAITQDIIQSAHDLSEGGLAVALAEMCFGGNKGAAVTIDNISELDRADKILFSESNTRFVIEVAPKNEDKLTALFKDLPLFKLGQVNDSKSLTISFGGKEVINSGIDEMKKAYQATMKRYF